MKLVSWSVTAAIAVAFLVNIPSQCVAVTAPQHTPEQLAAFKEANSLLTKAIQLYGEGKYSTAIPLAKRALELMEKVVGANDSNYAMPLTILANIYQAQGSYQQAQA
ncbi:MAG: tetratricopeptide repeat protein, partial [Nostocaceae cyanobacterium]|nr:tetratricopeptide repeat protein [Nostocaceae cyanobacterium]